MAKNSKRGLAEASNSKSTIHLVGRFEQSSVNGLHFVSELVSDGLNAFAQYFHTKHSLACLFTVGL